MFKENEGFFFPTKTTCYPDRKTFAMWKIGRGKHQKAWEQEIRREHNSNPLQVIHMYIFARRFSLIISLVVFHAIWWFSKALANPIQ